MNYYSTLPDLLTALNAVTATAEAQFGNLTAEQLNFKPSADNWSIAQCLDHLIVTNETYYPQFNEVIAGKHKNSFYQSIKLISNFFGKSMVRDLGPDKRKTFKNPGMFTPAQGNLPADVLQKYIAHQQVISAYFEKLSKQDIVNTVIYSPAAKIITYNLIDVMNIIVVHSQRHLQQATDVKAAMMQVNNV